MSSIEHVRSIMRRAVRKDILNILVIGCTHERYEQTLAKTNHNFYSYKMGKEWDKSYGEVPSNYKLVNEIPYSIDFDLVLVHTSDDRAVIGAQIARQFNIPIIRHTHTLPTDETEKSQHKDISKYINLNTFISHFSMQEWGYGDEYKHGTADYINHGIDIDFWSMNENDVKRGPYCLSVVNFWKDRDWACGWNIWNDNIRPNLPTKVLGKNPGLSEPPKTIELLRSEYHAAEVFVNTSLNSPVPMSLLEAMACGCAVVSTNSCMMSEFIKDNENGFVCNGVGEMVNRCETLLKNPELARTIGLAGQQTIKDKFSLNGFIQNWNNAFNRTLYK